MSVIAVVLDSALRYEGATPLSSLVLYPVFLSCGRSVHESSVIHLISAHNLCAAVRDNLYIIGVHKSYDSRHHKLHFVAALSRYAASAPYCPFVYPALPVDTSVYEVVFPFFLSMLKFTTYRLLLVAALAFALSAVASPPLPPWSRSRPLPPLRCRPLQLS